MSSTENIGMQLAKGVQYGASTFRAPDYYKWCVIPFAVAFILIGALCAWLLSSMDTRTIRRCVKDSRSEKKKCRDHQVAFRVWEKILVVLVVGVISGSIVASSSYSLGVKVYNPKVAAGLEAARLARNVWRR